MKKMKFIYLSILACSLMFVGCKKSDTVTPVSSKTFTVIAKSETNWVYFSFDKNDTVVVTNASTSSNWDLAFRRFNIETNSGVSGKGQGGAFSSGLIGQTGFDQLLTVPDTAKFMPDDSIMVAGAYGNLETIAANSILSNWYNYDMTTNVLSSQNSIYIVKTASGNYAKVWIENYYNPSDPNIVTSSGYIKLMYSYQPNGSKTLQ
jgi:hypothetical protein